MAPIASSPVVASAGFARSSPSQPVLVDQGDGQLVIDSDDLSSLTGSALARAVCARVFAAVHELLAPDGVLPERDADSRARARAEAMRLLAIVAEQHQGIQVRPWAERIASELCGLGALSARLAEQDVIEIFVHGPDRVLVRRGSAPPTEIDAKFSCPQAIEVVVQRLTGTHFGPDNPVVDARTLDGADVYAVHDSVATGGPVVNISLPSSSEPRHTLESLLGDGCLSPAIANLLATCVQAGLGILVCAGPGARAFPLVSALVDAAPSSDRHVLVRPMSEPGLLPATVVVLEGDGLVGTDGTTVMQALVRTAVGLRPDRMTVHEVGGAEAVEVLAAIGHGLVGTVVSTRANGASEGVQRLGTLLGLAGGSADATARAAYVAQSIDLVVCVARFPDGRSRVVEVAEALVGPDGVPTTVEIIGIDRTSGTSTYTWARPAGGAQPTFFAAMQRRGIAVDGLLGA
jgi:pilus assembly protein CpaF